VPASGNQMECNERTETYKNTMLNVASRESHLKVKNYRCKASSDRKIKKQRPK